MMSPANENDGAGSQVFNYAALGGASSSARSTRSAVATSTSLGVMAGLNVYSQVFSGPTDDLDMLDDRARPASTGAAPSATSASATRTGSTRRSARAPFVTLE